ncbi:discoidin domain-containing protein [Persicirhabdus sediminis]|uniref:Discoidin domain-containing protein n=1 Tax=Persicirhabdus sediminis TaxID=454144 RepID=A0A8J7MEA7_9BACT|nr:discoidin domain-containing protein [Persicirhabdus sediminis]MBK1790948.1 discoidin domain-containing protein [Persicirhabdus sediminis]
MKTKLLTSLLSLSFAISASAAWTTIDNLPGASVDGTNAQTSSSTDVDTSNLIDGGTGTGASDKWYTTAFDSAAPPVIIFDLGADITMDAFAVYGYHGNLNNGASNNTISSFTLEFATAAEGSTTFGQSYSKIDETIDAKFKNSEFYTSDYGQDITARYIKVTITGNFGGDIVGSTEMNINVVDTDVVPEPSALTLLGLGGLGLVLRRRRA